MERRIIKKWIWVWDFDKEERWLNTMAQQGWVLDKVGFCRYEFIPCFSERSTPTETSHRPSLISVLSKASNNALSTSKRKS